MKNILPLVSGVCLGVLTLSLGYVLFSKEYWWIMLCGLCCFFLGNIQGRLENDNCHD
jgi:hypothetical protein